MDRKVVEVSSDYLPTYLPTYQPTYLSMYLSIYLPTYLSIYVSIYLSIYLPTYLSIYLCFSLSLFHLITYLSISLSLSLSLSPICLSVCLSVCLFVCLSVCLQAWKRSYSARLPQFLNLTTSKTQQCSETSSIFAFDNVKSKAILRDFLIFLNWQHQKTKQFCETSFKNWKLSAELTASYQCVLPFFDSTCLNYCACREKWYRVIQSAAPVTQNHLSKPEDLMLQNATPLNISDEHVSCTARGTRHASLQVLFKCPTPAIVFGNATKPSRFAHFWPDAPSRAPATRNDIWTSKSALFRHLNFQKWSEAGVFSTFDFEMCFAPQRRALFRHLSFQKWSGAGVLSTFWLRHVVLRATTACNFSSLIWPAGSAPAALASPTFQPSGATSHWKNMEKHSVSRLSYLCAHLDLLSSETFSFLIFFLLLFSSLTLPTSAFHASILSEVWLLNFLR